MGWCARVCNMGMGTFCGTVSGCFQFSMSGIVCQVMFRIFLLVKIIADEIFYKMRKFVWYFCENKIFTIRALVKN